MVGKHYKYTAIFYQEAVNNIRALETLLEQLKQEHHIRIINAMFRALHTLKGNAGGMGFSEIANLSHALESFFDLIKKNNISVTQETFEILDKSLDELRKMVLAIHEPGIQTKSELDVKGLLEKTMENIQQQSEEKKDYREVEPRPFDPEPLQVNKSDLVFPKGKTDPPDEVDIPLIDGKIPLTCLMQKFHDVVERTAASVQKSVKLKFEGADTFVDVSLLPAIDRVLLHLVRNSVAHGIESETERVVGGKSEKGNIVVSISCYENRIVIEVQDDGRGLDYNKIKKIALATGMIHEEVADKLSNEHLSLLIFEPGFSTAENVSFIAGRGAGMDIVRATLYSVGGSISLKSEPGQGTSFIMTFPSSHPVSDFVMKHPEQIEKM